MHIRSRALGILVGAACGAAAAQSTLLTLHGVPGDDYGSVLVAVGDVNGDGLPDLAVAAPALASTATSGPLPAVRIVSGADGATLVTMTGASDDQLGAALAAAGDVDLDGVVDLLIGAPGNPGDVDYAQLRSGADGHVLWTLSGMPGIDSVDQFGAAVAGGRDADGDGVPDLLIGAPGVSTQSPYVHNFAYVQLFSGASGQLLLTVTDPVVAEEFGAGVCLVPDADGDGLADLLVGAPTGLVFGDDGRIELRSGTTGAVLQTVPGIADQQFGAWLRSTPDVDGDGASDILVGAGRDPAITFLYGPALLPFFEVGVDGPWPHSADACYFVNASGSPDLLAVDDKVQVDAVDTGWFVDLDGFDLSPQFELQGDADEVLGTSVEFVGDLNGDGWIECAVGSRTGAGPFGGTVHVLSLKELAWPVQFGSGCPGAGGFVPELSTWPEPVTPGLKLDLYTFNGLGGAPALMLFGLQAGSVPLANGCTLLVDPVLSFSLPFVLHSGGPGQGYATLSGLVPWGTPPGVEFVAQVFVKDPFAPGHKCATNGVRIEIE
jgi:hypothetical protein